MAIITSKSGSIWNQQAHYLTRRLDLMDEALRVTGITAIRAAKADGGWEWVVIDNREGSAKVGTFAKRAHALAAGEEVLMPRAL